MLFKEELERHGNIMNRQRISAFAAGVCAAVFGVLYPEYVLLPDTYEYIIMEKNCQEEQTGEETEQSYYDELEQMLSAGPEQIVVSSYFLDKLADKGIVLWKSKNLDKADMP